MKVVMLTEGAKPGTPRIEPKKIYPDGLDLRIEVNITFKQLWRQEPAQPFYFIHSEFKYFKCSEHLVWIINHESFHIWTLFFQEPQAEMFLRIEGFQVEIKEINKTWDQPTFVKNFKIGKFQQQKCCCC